MSRESHVRFPVGGWVELLSATRQIIVVFAIALVAMWAATEWVAWKLGYQPQLGQP
jgi:hypothetical protein